MRKLRETLKIDTKEEEKEEEEQIVGPIRFQHEEKEIALAHLAVTRTQVGTIAWAEAKEKLKQLKWSTLTEQQRKSWETAEKEEREANGKEGHKAASEKLRKLKIALGLGDRLTLSQTQKEDLKKAEEKLTKANTKEEEQKARQELEEVRTSFLTIEQKTELIIAKIILKQTQEAEIEKESENEKAEENRKRKKLDTARAETNLKRIKISLGLEDLEKIAKEEGSTNTQRTEGKKEIRLISERLIERAMTKLGKSLRADGKEPVNEVIRGCETALWKLPCQTYHISCRGGRPRINWLIETATSAWDKHKLWKHIGGKNKNDIPEDFDYRRIQHIKVIIQEALEGTF